MTATLYKAVRLPLQFDLARLKSEFDRIRDKDWIVHFNAGYHDGGWSGVALRSNQDDARTIYPDPAREDFSDTQLLARCPSIRSVLSEFKCPLLSVRLLRLKAGSIIKEHRDHKLGFEDGEVRIHIPISTNPGVEFHLDGDLIPMKEGEAWYVNVNLPHRVKNLGATDRVHLVIDCKVNDWLASLFAGGERPSPNENPDQGWAAAQDHARGRDLLAFKEWVWADQEMQNRLWNIQDRALFVREVLGLANERGFDVTEEEIERTMRDARRRSLNKWTVQ
ncbi:MAG: aspartyl/asparaginyl beta-hydroxylase domain-containing protein [Burkholderiales bacterium]